MLSCLWSVKGGVGTTVVAAATALRLASRSPSPVVLVDLAGDLPAALGLPEPGGAGVAEWSRGEGPRVAAELLVTVTPGLWLLPRGQGPLADIPTGPLLALGPVVVDAGVITDAASPRGVLVAAAEHSWLVTRACYLALRRAVLVGRRPTGIVLVSEPGRSLTSADVAAVVGAPVVADIPCDPAVGRAVDAGLLVARLPEVLRHAPRSGR